VLEKLSKNVKITLSILFCFIGLVLITYTYFDGIKSNLFNQKNYLTSSLNFLPAEKAGTVLAAIFKGAPV